MDDRERGGQRRKYPLDPHMQAAICRQYARDLRKEHAAGMPPVPMTTGYSISRDKAAESMDARAARWEAEIKTGILNHKDRKSMGF